MAKRFVGLRSLDFSVDSSEGLDFDCIVVREAKNGQFLRHVIERIQICEDKVEVAWSAGWKRDNLFEAVCISYASRAEVVKISKNN